MCVSSLGHMLSNFSFITKQYVITVFITDAMHMRNCNFGDHISLPQDRTRCLFQVVLLGYRLPYNFYCKMTSDIVIDKHQINTMVVFLGLSDHILH